MDGNWLIQPGLVIAWYLGFASSLLAGQLAKAPRRGTLQALLLKEIDRVIDAHQDPIKSVEAGATIAYAAYVPTPIWADYKVQIVDLFPAALIAEMYDFYGMLPSDAHGARRKAGQGVPDSESVKEVAEKGTDLQNALKRVRAYPPFVIISVLVLLAALPLIIYGAMYYPAP